MYANGCNHQTDNWRKHTDKRVHTGRVHDYVKATEGVCKRKSIRLASLVLPERVGALEAPWARKNYGLSRHATWSRSVHSHTSHSRNHLKRADCTRGSERRQYCATVLLFSLQTPREQAAPDIRDLYILVLCVRTRTHIGITLQYVYADGGTDRESFLVELRGDCTHPRLPQVPRALHIQEAGHEIEAKMIVGRCKHC